MYKKLKEKPWGFYIVLDEGRNFKVKTLAVYPGEKLSEQKHKYRKEYWTVVEGNGLIYREIRPNNLLASAATAGSFVIIEEEQWHSLENVGDDDLVVIEVQLGDYLQEDDIERRADKYGRCD